MYIGSGGNVGIGDNPAIAYRLKVLHTGTGALQLTSTGASAASPTLNLYDLTNGTTGGFSCISGGVALGAISNHPLSLIVNSTERVTVTTGGLVGIGVTSPGAMIQASTTAAATKGLIVKGFTSQSANLQEWQNSAGTVLASVDSSGRLTIATNATASNADLYFNNSSSVNPGVKWNSVSGSTGLRFYSTSTLIGAFQDNGVCVTTAGFATYGGMNYGAFTVNRTGAASINFNSSGAAISVSAGSFTTADSTMQITVPAASKKGLVVVAAASQTGNLQDWQNSAGTALAYMDANGNFFAVSKSFLIPHPTSAKAAEGKKLRYASLEGPENGVYYRGRLEGESEIVLPDYWKDLVDPESITVNLTARKFAQPSLFVVDANAEKVIVKSDREINCDFVVYGTRKDIAKLEVEPDGE